MMSCRSMVAPWFGYILRWNHDHGFNGNCQAFRNAADRLVIREICRRAGS
jgi:hypothetical protein